MAGLRVDASELHTLAVTLDASTGRLGARASAVLRKTAYDVEAASKALCPVDTGNLRASISTSIRGGGMSMEAEIGPTAEYAAYVEYGTSRMSPQPYMGPAFDRHAAGMVSAFAELAGGLL